MQCGSMIQFFKVPLGKVRSVSSHLGNVPRQLFFYVGNNVSSIVFRVNKLSHDHSRVMLMFYANSSLSPDKLL